MIMRWMERCCSKTTEEHILFDFPEHQKKVLLIPMTMWFDLWLQMQSRRRTRRGIKELPLWPWDQLGGAINSKSPSSSSPPPPRVFIMWLLWLLMKINICILKYLIYPSAANGPSDWNNKDFLLSLPLPNNSVTHLALASSTVTAAAAPHTESAAQLSILITTLLGTLRKLNTFVSRASSSSSPAFSFLPALPSPRTN